MKIELFAEYCCEICNDIIHNHFDCPVCKKNYAGTTLYGSVYEEDVGFVLSCEECGAQFELISKDGYEYDWKLLTNKGTKTEGENE